jgi:nucleoid-associated protein EbfC
MAKGGPKQPNMNELLKQAQKMQQQLMEAQASAAEQEVEGTAGGGMVKVRMTGGMEVRGITIEPAVVDPDDIAMLEDLVLAAIRDAFAKAGKLTESAMGGFDLGGLGGGMPGLL